mgnify:CR=1 FL=1
MIFIDDPVAGLSYMLNPRSTTRKRCRRCASNSEMKVPSPPGEGSGATAEMPPPLPPPPQGRERMAMERAEVIREVALDRRSFGVQEITKRVLSHSASRTSRASKPKARAPPSPFRPGRSETSGRSRSSTNAGTRQSCKRS